MKEVTSYKIMWIIRIMILKKAIKSIFILLWYYCIWLQAKSGLIVEDDARPVAKMLKNSISTLTKEREERKLLEREIDGVAGMLTSYM